MITGIADIVAITSYISYWAPNFPEWGTSFICVLTLLILNLATVKLFGEMEFWFSMIKITAIVSLIIVGIVLISIGFESPAGHTAALENIWNDGGMFPKGLSGFFCWIPNCYFCFCWD